MKKKKVRDTVRQMVRINVNRYLSMNKERLQNPNHSIKRGRLIFELELGGVRQARAIVQHLGDA